MEMKNFNKLHEKRGVVFGENKEFCKKCKKFSKRVFTNAQLYGKLWENIKIGS